MQVADEKDKLAPQLEEARWKARQLEKDLQDVTENRDGLQQAAAEMEAAVEQLRVQEAVSAGELGRQLEASQAEAANLREQVAAMAAAAEAQAEALAGVEAEKQRLEGKVGKHRGEVEALEERLRARGTEVDAARAAADAVEERLADSEARGRDLYEENKRLTEHISVGLGAVALWAGSGQSGGVECACPATSCRNLVH